jgi:threonine synthase
MHVSKTAGICVIPTPPWPWGFTRNIKKERAMILRPSFYLASPYKFASSVLNALGNESNDSERVKTAQLSALTETKIPATLAALWDKPVRFNEMIDKEDITEILKTKLGLK